MAVLLLRIFAPQIAGLAGYAVARLLRLQVMIAQLAAVLLTASVAGYVSATSLEGVARIGAFVTLEIFVALLGQLLIVAAQE